MLLILVEITEIDLSVHNSLRLQPQSYFHATYTFESDLSTTATELLPCYLSRWNDLCKWLVSPHTAVTELPPCYLLWWKYLWKWPVSQQYPQTHCSYGSIWKWLVSPLQQHTASTDRYLFWWVSVKVACQSLTITTCSHRTPWCWWKYLLVYKSNSLQPQDYFHICMHRRHS